MSSRRGPAGTNRPLTPRSAAPASASRQAARLSGDEVWTQRSTSSPLRLCSKHPCASGSWRKVLKLAKRMARASGHSRSATSAMREWLRRPMVASVRASSSGGLPEAGTAATSSDRAVRAASAAWRLESLGFAEVYDYTAGKLDLLAAVLATEESNAFRPRAVYVARHDV